MVAWVGRGIRGGSGRSSLARCELDDVRFRLGPLVRRLLVSLGSGVYNSCGRRGAFEPDDDGPAIAGEPTDGDAVLAAMAALISCILLANIALDMSAEYYMGIGRLTWWHPASPGPRLPQHLHLRGALPLVYPFYSYGW
jgi:hypothetical protein